MKRWSQSAIVGIEIATDAVYLLQLHRGTKKRGDVSHHATVPLPPGAMIGMQIADMTAVGAAIAQARQAAGTKARHAVVALAAPAALLHLLAVPAALGEADLEAQLELVATRLLPADGPVSMDFEVLGPLPDDPAQQQILLSVAKTGAVRQCVAALEAGGLHVQAVDVEALALARALAVLTGQILEPQQVLTLTRQTAVAMLPDGWTPDITPQCDTTAWLLTCGLAAWGMSA